jgi:hypothetical protein
MIQRSNSSTMLNFAQFQYLAKRQISSGPPAVVGEKS